MKSINSKWARKDIKLINPSEDFEEGQVFKCISVIDDMCKFTHNEEVHFLRQNRFELVDSAN